MVVQPVHRVPHHLRVVFMKEEEHAENKEQGDSYQTLLGEHGGSCGFLQVLTSKMCHEEELKRRLMLMDPSDSNGVILTSRRAAETFVTCAKDLQSLCPLTCFVVGERTAKAVSALGLPCEGSESGNAESLAKYVCRWIETRTRVHLLFLCGDKRRNVLPLALKQLKARIPFEFDELMVYRTRPIDSEELLARYKKLDRVVGVPTHLVFFSPSGVNASGGLLARLVDMIAVPPIFVAIGATTQQALKNYFANRASNVVILVSRKPNPAEVWSCISSHEKWLD